MSNCFLSYSHDESNISKSNNIKQLLSYSTNHKNYSEKIDKSNCTEETIWNYLQMQIKCSSCTILFLTKDLLTFNNHKINYIKGNFIKSGWIYNELSASLRDWKENRINGIVCVIDDNIYGNILEISKTIYYLYELPEILSKNKDYIVFTSYSEFINNHNMYINRALKNRNDQIESCGKKFTIIYNLHNNK